MKFKFCGKWATLCKYLANIGMLGMFGILRVKGLMGGKYSLLFFISLLPHFRIEEHDTKSNNTPNSQKLDPKPAN